jgi:hypothetical protein
MKTINEDKFLETMIDTIEEYYRSINGINRKMDNEIFNIIDSLATNTTVHAKNTIFGQCMEKCFLKFAKLRFDKAYKSKIKGMDFEIVHNNIKYAVQLKTSPKWGNSSSFEKLIKNFENLKNSNNNCVRILSFISSKNTKYNKKYIDVFQTYNEKTTWDFFTGRGDYIELIKDAYKIYNEY